MLQLIVEILPFAVFVTIGVAAWYEPSPPRNSTAHARRARRFCELSEGQGLVLSDPDGRPVRHNR